MIRKVKPKPSDEDERVDVPVFGSKEPKCVVCGPPCASEGGKYRAYRVFDSQNVIKLPLVFYMTLPISEFQVKMREKSLQLGEGFNVEKGK